MAEQNKYARDSASLSLHDLLSYGRILGVSELEFSNDMTMREFKSELEKHILE